MKTLSFISFFIIFMFSSNLIYSQKPVLQSETEVSEVVNTELNILFSSKDFLKEKIKKFNSATGSVMFDLGILDNGKINTYFKVEDTLNNPMFVNFISSYIMQHQFYFKLEKKKKFKVRFTNNF